MVLKSTAVLTPASVPRRLPDWIEAFVDYTSGLPTPLIIRKWAAISAIAAALERKVWINSLNTELYPNLYVMVVAPPGIGKGLVISELKRLFSIFKHGELFLAPTNVSRASLIDCLSESTRVHTSHVNPMSTFNSLYVLSAEFGSLIPSYENDFMMALTDIYDGNPYEERKRTAKTNIKIERPQLNFLGATTPSFLTHFMPAGAWEQGFISRTVLVYSGEVNRPDLFEEASRQSNSDLQVDLKTIAGLSGRIGWQDSAAKLFRVWYNDGCPPVPTIQRLANYVTRRHTHAQKLCMISCAARGNTYIISPEDVNRAVGWLIEAESEIQNIFMAPAMGDENQGHVIEDVKTFIVIEYGRHRKPVIQERLVDFLKGRIHLQNIMPLITLMVNSRMLEVTTHDERVAYKPPPL
jgi:Protein of unknown function (DUF3987)